jgi:hypothetical protein
MRKILVTGSTGDIEKIYADGNLVKNKLGWIANESLEKALISA